MDKDNVVLLAGKAAERMRDAQETAAYWEKHKGVMTPLLARLPKLTNAEASGFDFDLDISGSKHDLEAAWGALRKAGLECRTPRPKANAATWLGKFEGDNELVVWLHFASTVCRRVKIGTEIVTRDVYETVCGEMELPT